MNAGLGKLFSDIPVTIKPWVRQMEEKILHVDPSLPGENIYFAKYPLTEEDSSIYFSTSEDPICLLRIGYKWDDKFYPELSQAVQRGGVSLSIKAFCYPSYPILQIVLKIHPMNLELEKTDTWCRETLGDICDGNIQSFLVDCCRSQRWKLVLARYDPYKEEQLGKLINPVSITTPVSSDQVDFYIVQAQNAINHFRGIPKTNLDFYQAANQFLKDAPPLGKEDY